MTARVLFVCRGNICRSPTAEAVCRSIVAKQGLEDTIHVDSAGTGSWHIGEAPDSRTQDTALSRGIDMSWQRARQVTSDDFFDFDYLLAMDRQNLSALRRLQPDDHSAVVELYMNYSRRSRGIEVPDPYYGGSNGFNIVFDMVEEASRELINQILAAKPGSNSR